MTPWNLTLSFIEAGAWRMGDRARHRTVRGQYPPTGFAHNGELTKTQGGQDFGHPFFCLPELHRPP